jgi:hypothetical protein
MGKYLFCKDRDLLKESGIENLILHNKLKNSILEID